MTYAITGNDTLTLNNRVLADFADKDVSTVTFPNNVVEMKTGKNGNTIYSRNAPGDNAEMVLRILKGTPDDSFLQGIVSNGERDFVGTPLIEGSFVKMIGDGNGGLKRDVYTLLGGVITKKPENKENVEGDTDQGVTVYNLKFARALRSIE